MQAYQLYEKLSNEGLFWSYNKSAGYVGDELLIEHTLIYGETDDIKVLFENFSKEKLIDVWNRKLIPDERLYGLNYYLAVIWFDISEPIDYIKNLSKKYSRYERLKNLI